MSDPCTSCLRRQKDKQCEVWRTWFAKHWTNIMCAKPRVQQIDNAREIARMNRWRE
jgi:hypothetical protein